MQTQSEQPIRKTILVNGVEREYFIRLPKGFDPNKTCWALVAAHGGGGNGHTFWMSDRLQTLSDELGLDAITISPSFDISDPPEEAYPLLGGISFLNTVLEQARRDFNLHPRILLTGYSRGGQFSHRYALWHPNNVEACAPCSSGAWTTPDGRLLVSPLGEIDPKSFLASYENVEKVTPSVSYIFDARIVDIATTPAKPDAKRIPFLVMCGTEDERYETAQKFVESLENDDYHVETAWPQTAHGGRNEEPYRTEFEKYPRKAVEFFLRVIEVQLQEVQPRPVSKQMS